MATSFYVLMMVSGQQQSDQNDAVFVEYISLSIWCWVEYIHSKKKYWLILMAVFSGFAILCKWLVGALVYLMHFVYSFIEKRTFKQVSTLFVPLLITLLIVLPWQIYILLVFPAEAKVEYGYNNKHFFEAVEGHSGSLWYHFDMINKIFGQYFLYIIIVSAFFFWKQMKNKKAALSIGLSIILVYVFFSIAKTKMPSFTCVVILPVLLVVAYLIHFCINRIDVLKIPAYGKALLMAALLGGIVFLRLDWKSLEENYDFFSGKTGTCNQALIKNKQVFKNLAVPENSVLFNVKGRHFVEAMYYTEYTAYSIIPSQEQYADLIKKDFLPVIFKGPNDSIPRYMLDDGKTIILNENIIDCE